MKVSDDIYCINDDTEIDESNEESKMVNGESYKTIPRSTSRKVRESIEKSEID